jgi:hypothetical protein
MDEPQPTVNDISSRLLAGRYGEIRHLRQLEIVEKRAAGLEALLSRRSPDVPRVAVTDEGASAVDLSAQLRSHLLSSVASRRRSLLGEHLSASEDVTASSQLPEAEQETPVVNELRTLSTSRRVSGIADAFRQRLEQAVRGQASRRPRPEPSVRRTSEMNTRTPTATAAPTATNGGRVSDQSLHADLAALNARGRVGALLNDSSLRQRIERVLLMRLRDPDSIRRNRDDIEARAATSRPARPRVEAPTAREVPASPPAHGAASLESLNLVTNASFELLLSLQRTIQQDLAAALETRIQNATPSETVVPSRSAVDSDDGEDANAVVMPAWPSRDALRPFSTPTGGQGRLGACVVCTTSEVDTVFYRCGHLATCARCAHNLRRRRANCPICRAPVRDVMQVFLACAPSTNTDEE